ncbi:serine hydrolase domain-containing protein [Cohnella hongkongensis]|uniref:Serine hydrolase domain-containing protein n=1 Tax=Cohnella hongkongensis TaxID=178337 RepID=A0ABV9FMH2_9BACL
MTQAEQWMDRAPQLGMNPDRLRTAIALVESAVESGAVPGAVFAIERDGQRLEFACGIAFEQGGTAVPAGSDTLYDCASLTKTTVTLPLVLMLLEQGRILLQDPLALYLPDFATSDIKASVTIARLLTHTAGFPPTLDLHSRGWSRERIVQSLIELEPEQPPGARIVYSDIGYILLGHLTERLYGETLERAARRHIFEPLGMTDSVFCPPPALHPRTAETEWYPGEPAPRRAIVHDENAAAMGGVSGHAGLFSTARDLTRYMQAWLGGGSLKGLRWLSPAAVALATSCQTAGVPGGNRGLGWVLKGDKFDVSGDLLSAGCYGHTGFTGTSAYADPASGLSIVLLTNSVRKGRDRSVVSRLRAAVHNAVAAALTN